jgi:drug/metabolite transporter (DMT)-like permease
VTQSRLTRVVLWMTGALLSFSTMAVSIRQLAGILNLFEVLTIRNLTGVLVLSLLAILRPELRRSINTKRLRLHLLRNGVHAISQFAWAVSLTLLPLATVFALEFTMPAWTAILAVFFLNERLTPSRIGVVIFGVLGVLIIVRPGLESFHLGSMLVLSAAFGYAITLVATKKLTATDSTFAIIFWMNVIQLPMMLAGSNPASYLKLHSTAFIPVLGLGIAGLSAHYCLTNAFRAGDASVVVPIDFLRIPLIAIVGWWFYGETLDVFVFIGAALIIVGVLWNLRAEATRPTEAKAATQDSQRRPA